MKSIQEENQQFGKRIQKFRERLKLKLFSLVFEMHSIVHLSSTLAGILLAIDFISNVILIAYLRILSLPNTQSLFLIELNIVEFANQTLFINEVNYFLNSFFVFAFFYFVCVLLFTNPNKQRGRSESWKLNFMIITLYSIHTCFSTLIIATQCVNIFCASDVANFSCLEGQNIISLIVSLIGIVPCLLNSYFIENVYNFQFMGINGETGILSNQRSFTLVGPLSKYFCLSIYYSGLPGSITSIMFICVSLIYLIQLYVRFKLSYNFSKFLSEIEVTGMAICAYNYALCVIVNTLDFEATNGDFFISFILNFVIAYLVYLLKKSSWNNKLDDNFLSIKSIAQKEIYAYRMLECVMKFTFSDQLLLSGLIKTHKKQCTHKKCLCSFEKLMKEIKDEEHKRLILDFKIMKAGLEEGTNLLPNKERQISQKGLKTSTYQGSLLKIKNNQQLQYLNILLKWLEISYVENSQQRMRIIQAFIQTEFLDKDLHALYLLSALKHKKMNLKEQFAIFCYQKIIFEKVNDRIKNLNTQSLDITQILKSIHTEKKLTKLYQNIELTVNDCQKFWKMVAVKEKGLDFIKLHKLSLGISESALRAEKLYKEIRKIQPSFFNIIIIYCKFQKHVLNYEGDSIKEQNELTIAIQKRGILRAQSIEFSNELQDLNQKVGLIVLKTSEKSLGRISLVNTELANLTKQSMERLTNSNLSLILPSVIDESSHNKCLESFYTERTQSTFINQKQNLWVKDIDGFLILVDFYVQPFFDQVLGLQLIAYLKQTEKMEINDVFVPSADLYTIITDINGKIQCSSKNFSKILSCSNSEDLMNSDINIFTLCPDLTTIISNDRINQGESVDLILTELNLEVSECEKLHSSIQRQTLNSLQTSEHIQIKEMSALKEITFNKSDQQSLNLSKKNIAQIRIRGDVRFMDGFHKYFCFGVFYFSFVTNDKLITINIEELMSDGLPSQNGQSIDQGSMTASSASSSDGKRAKRIDNLKNEYEIMKTPRIIGLFQKIFMIYFAIFLGLAIGLMVTSTQFVTQVFEDLQQLETSKRAFDQIIEMRKNFREVILIYNNQTILQSPLVKQRSEVFKYTTQQQLNTLKDLSYKINTYILSNVDNSKNSYAKSLQNEELQLQELNSNGKAVVTPQKFPSALQMLIQQVQVMLSVQNKTCNCLFRPSDFQHNSSFTEFERNFYFVDKNSVDVVGKFLYQKLDDLEKFIQESSDNSQMVVLFLSVPGVFISVLCTVIFFPVLMMMTNNRKGVIQMLARLKIRTSKVQLKKLDKFLGDLQSNKDKKSSSGMIQLDDLEYDQIQDESLQKSTQYLADSLVKIDVQDSSISIQNVEISQSINRVEFNEMGKAIFEQSLSEKQLIEVKEKGQKSFKKENQNDKTLKSEKNAETFSDIERQFKKKNCYHFVNLSILALIYSSFFGTMYYFNTRVSQLTNEAVDIISVFEDRSACISAIPLYVRERLIQNQTILIGFLDNKKIDSLFEMCLLNAYQVLQYRKDVPSCLSSGEDLVNLYEGPLMCDASDSLYQKDDFLRKQYMFQCSDALNGILESGISQSYNYYLAEFRKYEISFEGIQPTAQNLLSSLKDARFISFQGSITYFLKPVIADLNISIYEKVKAYLEEANKNSLIVFVIFILVLFTLILVILVYLVKVVQRQLYFNKKVIKFMPMLELQRKTMQKMLKKLNI